MEFDKIHNKGQARIFGNRYLEMLTRTHPLVIWGMYLPVIVYMLYYSYNTLKYSRLHIALVFAGAVVFWTFFEYIAHRYIFHWISGKASVKKITYALHGNHHHYPRDKSRLFMPPVPSVIIAVVLFGIFYLVVRSNVYAFFPGFITGYLLYASMHYAIHSWAPPFKWAKPLWRNHHLHHYKDEALGFGVSSTIWDRIFGTMFRMNKTRK